MYNVRLVNCLEMSFVLQQKKMGEEYRERRKFQKRTEFSLWKNVHQGFFIKGPGRITVYFELKIILFFKRNICIFASKIKPVIFLQIFEFSRQILSYKLKKNSNDKEFFGQIAQCSSKESGAALQLSTHLLLQKRIFVLK